MTGRLVPGRSAAPALACCLAVAALAMSVGLTPLSNNDVWLHLTTGRLILERGAIPEADEYSYTRAGAPYVPHEWLSQVLLWLIHDRLGVTGLIALKPIALVLSAGLTALTCLKLGASPLASCWASVLAIAAMTSHLFARPHLATFVLLAAASYLLVRLRSGERWMLVPLLLLQAAWVNLHAGSVLGVLLAAALGRWTAAAAVAAVSLANPSGWGLYRFALQFTDPVFRREIREWSGPFSQPFAGSFHFWVFALVLLLGLAAAVWHARRGEAGPVAVAVLFGCLALTGKRHASVLGVAAAPWIARAVPEAARALRLRLAAHRASPSPAAGTGAGPAGRLALSAAAVLALAGTAAALGVPHETGLRRRPGLGLGPNVPVEALDYATSAGLEGAALTSFGFGSYVTFRAWPRTRVFIDSRLDVYGGGFIEDFLAAMADPVRMRGMLARRPADYAVLSYRLEQVEGAVAALGSDPGWALVHYDDVAMVYARREARWLDLVGRDEYKVTNPYLYLSGRLAFAAAAGAAIRECERALQRSPGSVVARLMRGNALQAAGRHREAVAALEDAGARIGPEDAGRPLLLGLLGTSYLALGERDLAERAFTELLETAPASAFARRMLEETRSAGR